MQKEKERDFPSPFGLMQGVIAGEVYVVQEVDGVVCIYYSVAVKVRRLIDGVIVWEVYVIQEVNSIVCVQNIVAIRVTDDVRRSFVTTFVADEVIRVVIDVRYGAGLTTNVTIRIANVVVLMSFTSGFVGYSADRTLHPVSISILILYRIIVGNLARLTTLVAVGITSIVIFVVGNLTNIAAFIASGITSVVVVVSFTSRFVDCATDRTFEPVLSFAMFQHTIIMDNRTNIAAFITSGIARIIVTVCFAGGLVGSSTHTTLHPMVGFVLILNGIVVRRGAMLLADVTIGIAYAIVGVRHKSISLCTAEFTSIGTITINIMPCGRI